MLLRTQPATPTPDASVRFPKSGACARLVSELSRVIPMHSNAGELRPWVFLVGVDSIFL